MNRNEETIVVVEAHVLRCVSPQEIIVNVEQYDLTGGAMDFDLAQTSVVARAVRGLERRQGCARARDPIAARPECVTRDENLIAAKTRGRDVEMGGGTGPATHT